MFDVAHIIQAGGLLLIAAMIFGESGMFIGFFFPGDTLLLSAGIFAAQGKLPLALTITVIALAAIAGDNTGYFIGKKLGPRLFRKKDSLVFRHEHVVRTHKFFETYGSKTMLVAHFIPIVRTFAPLVAGVGEMKYKQFVVFDAVGDISWAIIVTMLGYWFGSRIPNLESYILPTFFVVTVLTFGPTLYHIFKDPKIRGALLGKLGFGRSKD